MKTFFSVLFFFILAFELFPQATCNISGTIIETKTMEPVMGAQVWLLGTDYGALTDPDGNYLMVVKPGDYELRVSLLGYRPVMEKVKITDGETLVKNYKLDDLIGAEELAVVGSRGEERTAFNSLVPIDIISEDEIRKSGLHETAEVLHRFVPSVNLPRPSITDGTDHSNPFTLRGLGSDQVLVLVNGKRRHTTALVHANSSIGRGSTSIDLNTIPVSSIKKIEVLRDGAAAQYGSDAIAGIINIVLKDEPGGVIASKFQESYEGDGRTYQFTNSLGFNVLNQGTFNITAEFRDKNYTNRAAASQGLGSIDAPLNGKNVFRHGEGSSRDLSIIANTSVPMNENSDIYAVANFNKRHGEAAGYYRFPSQSRTLVAVYPQGFLPLIAPDITDAYMIFGIKTRLSDWVLDVSSTYGNNSFEFNIINTINSSMGPTSQKSFYAGALKFNQSTTNIDLFRSVDLGLPNPLSVGLGAELRFENFSILKGEESSYFVGTYKDSVLYPDGTYKQRVYPGGAQVFPGFQPSNETDRSRNNVALYADLENKLHEKLLIGIAGRYENFSDFGKTLNGKLSLRYEAVEKLVFRGSVSTGFRAPSLAQSYFTSTATNTINGVPFQIGTLSVEHPLAKELGANPLKPEKSTHVSGGIATQIIKNLSVSVDYFYVQIKDRIVFSGNFTTSNSSSYIKNLLNSYKIGGARFFTNAIDTKTQGVDVVLKYSLNMKESGVLFFSAGANINKTAIEGSVKYPSQIAKTDTAKQIFFDQIERARTQTMQPQNTLNASINYQLNNLSVFLRAQRYGDITVAFDAFDPAKKQSFSAKVLTDLDISYKFFEVLTLSAGGHNIFDVYPDETEAKYKLALPNDALIYSPFSPFGFSGADYYLRLSYSL